MNNNKLNKLISTTNKNLNKIKTHWW